MGPQCKQLCLCCERLSKECKDERLIRGSSILCIFVNSMGRIIFKAYALCMEAQMARYSAHMQRNSREHCVGIALDARFQLSEEDDMHGVSLLKAAQSVS